MACEVPCVTTEVGDAADILGDRARVVPPGNTEALAKAILGVLSRPMEARQAMGIAGRSRIADRYPIASIVARYESLWSDLAAQSGGRS